MLGATIEQCWAETKPILTTVGFRRQNYCVVFESTEHHTAILHLLFYLTLYWILAELYLLNCCVLAKKPSLLCICLVNLLQRWRVEQRYHSGGFRRCELPAMRAKRMMGVCPTQLWQQMSPRAGSDDRALGTRWQHWWGWTGGAAVPRSWQVSGCASLFLSCAYPCWFVKDHFHYT